MQKQKSKKLTLSTETVRTLSLARLIEVAGGNDSAITCATACNGCGGRTI